MSYISNSITVYWSYFLISIFQAPPAQTEGVEAEGGAVTMVLPLSDSVVKPENLTDIISDRRLPTGVHLSTTAEVPGLVQLQRPLDTRVCSGECVTS